MIQTVAEMLQVPLNQIRVKPTNSFVGANAMGSGASVTSEMICYVNLFIDIYLVKYHNTLSIQRRLKVIDTFMILCKI